MTLLSVDRLALTLDGREILRDVSFDLRKGEIAALVGESGSGKSMTALALIGLAPPGARVAGRAQLDGRALLTLTERGWLGVRGSEIGMVFQEPMSALNPVHTIGAQVAEGVRRAGAGRAEAARIARDRLDRVGLRDIPADRYPHELSGGQRQRVCIAMAIARRPKLLIADEPTTALDVTTQARVLDLLRDLAREEGMGLLLITHDLGVVAGLADRTHVMQDGRVVEGGTTADLFAAPSHPYTRDLLAAARPAPHAAPPCRDAPVVLRAEGVVRDHGATRAVDGVGFALHTGESLGLVGESGSGKTTLARALLGLDRVQGGRITLLGRPVGPEMARADRARIGVVFQDPYGSFDPRWTVRRIVTEPFHLTNRPRDAAARAAEALARVGIGSDALERYPHEFSGGQRQRIAIARALITRPDVLVLDEAVSALDVRVRAQVLDLLAGLRAELGLAYLFITHDLGVVRAACDRVMVMRAGRLVEEGPVARVLSAPATAYAAELVAAAPSLDGVP